MKGEVKGKVIFNWRKNHDSLEIHPRRCPFYLLKAKAVELRVEIAKREKKGARVENKLSSKMGQLIISLGSLFARYSVASALNTDGMLNAPRHSSEHCRHGER